MGRTPSPGTRTDTHNRVRADRIDQAVPGWPHAIGLSELDGARAAGKGAAVTDNNNDERSEDLTGERTSAFRADFSNEQDAAATAGVVEDPLFGVDALPPGSALLLVKRGPNAGSRFLLDRATTTAGRHPNSDIFLDDITVSRRHAQFCCLSGEFQVVDAGSLNGTYLNREPVESAVLANGDEVQIGKFRLVFLTGPQTGDTERAVGPK
jgi:pSer/pThr/pTyr-binding forkhead associated (FHA) protein